MGTYEINVQWKSDYYGKTIVVCYDQKPNTGDLVLVRDTNTFHILSYYPPYLKKPESKDMDMSLVDIIGTIINIRS